MTDDLQPQVLESSARAFQRDLYFYWSTARAHPLSLTKDRRLYQRDLRLVNDALLQQQDVDSKNELDVPRLIFLRLLMTQLKLLVAHDDSIRAIPAPAFLAIDAPERVRRTFVHWRDGTFWNELMSVPELTIRGVESRLDRVPHQIAEARQSVLAQMTELCRAQAQGTHWTAISRLLEYVQTREYEFLLPREYLAIHAGSFRYQSYLSHASPYISYGNAMGWSFLPPIEDEADGWQLVEAGFIRSMLIEPMYWMGLVDIGMLDGIPTAYRLTPIGAWILGVGPEVELPEEGGRVVVQPNFELYAFDPISDLVLSKLDEFAERVQAERAIKYRLTRQSVYRAQKQGWTAADIFNALQEMIQSPDADRGNSDRVRPLPQNIVRTLQEWQSLHERVTIYRRAGLLQAANAQLLASLIQDPSIRRHLAKPIDGADADETTLAIIPPSLGEAEELARALARAGYPALRTRSPQDSVRPTLLLDESKLTPAGIPAEFDVALPSIFLLDRLAPFATADERGNYHLTPSSIQNAVDKGTPVKEILASLRALHRGPIPHAVERQILAWGHYYGHAAVEQVTLVQIKDVETLNELMREPDIQALMRPFLPDPSRALAMIAQENRAELVKVLARYGITVQNQLDRASLQTTSSAQAAPRSDQTEHRLSQETDDEQ